jgi:protein-S-isoprenylcysteine O-methyltransferase Ste14
MPHLMTPHLTTDLIVRWTSLLWLLLSAVWLGSLPFVKPTLHRSTRSSRIQHLILFAAGLYLLFGTSSTSDWLNQPLWKVTLPIAFVGLSLTLCGVAFGIWARLTLGENWSGTPTIKQNHTLILRGPYRIVRHPIYTGLLVAFLGSAVERGLVRNLLAVPVCAVALWIKSTVEEDFMEHRFGAEYLRYRARVSALVPFLF